MESDYSVRKLQASDLNEENVGRWAETLSRLGSEKTQLTQELALALLAAVESQGSEIFAAFDLDDNICGTLTLMLEIKILRGGSVAGHIEDVAVYPGLDRRGIGYALVEKAIERCRTFEYMLPGGRIIKPYKIILDADQETAGPFYESLQFKLKEGCYKLYL